MFFIGNKQIKPSFSNGGDSSDIETITAKNLSGNVINKGDKVWVDNYKTTLYSILEMNNILDRNKDNEFWQIKVSRDGSKVGVCSRYNTKWEYYNINWSNNPVTLTKVDTAIDNEIITDNSSLVYNGGVQIGGILSYDYTVGCQQGSGTGYGTIISKLDPITHEVIKTLNMPSSSSGTGWNSAAYKINDEEYYITAYYINSAAQFRIIKINWDELTFEEIAGSPFFSATPLENNVVFYTDGYYNSNTGLYSFNPLTNSFTKYTIPSLDEYINKIRTATGRSTYIKYYRDSKLLLMNNPYVSLYILLKYDPNNDTWSDMNLKIDGFKEENQLLNLGLTDNGSIITFRSESTIDGKTKLYIGKLDQTNGYAVSNIAQSYTSNNLGVANELIPNGSIGEMSILK